MDLAGFALTKARQHACEHVMCARVVRIEFDLMAQSFRLARRRLGSHLVAARVERGDGLGEHCAVVGPQSESRAEQFRRPFVLAMRLTVAIEMVVGLEQFGIERQRALE
jgi:hypothetical protein